MSDKPAVAPRETQTELRDAVIAVLSHFDNCDKCGLTEPYKNRLRAALEGGR